MDSRDLLIVSRDPGGTRQMIGLYAALRGEAPDLAADAGLRALSDRLGTWARIRVMAKDFALPLWRQVGISPVTWEVSEQALAQIGAVLTATGNIDDDALQRLWLRARAASCPCHAFVDCADNVRQRFLLQGKIVAPDFVYIPDPACLPGLDGIVPPSRITLIPDLVRWVVGRELAAAREGGDRLRALWRRGRERPVLLFASEPVAEFRALGIAEPYSEFACLDRLLAGIAGEESLQGLPHRDWLVVVRPHPKEAAGKFDAYDDRIIVSREGSSAEAILAADLVVGMRSSMLREAAEAGRPVLSMIGD